MRKSEWFIKLKNAGVDLSLLGWEMSESSVTYFCTPKGATILGWAGVEGIHYCRIRGFGEMIFAISPENLSGDQVHPIARNEKDLLGLLLMCDHMAAIEQAHGWSLEEFESYMREMEVSPEQKAVLQKLEEITGISPMEDPFSYIKTLQEEFDYSKLKFTEDYYDIEMNPAAPTEPGEWKVFYEGGYWMRKGKSRPGVEIPLGVQFSWGEEIWHVPSLYSCRKGFVVDFCVEIQPERMKEYLEKWMPLLEKEWELTEEQRQQARAENPLNVEFRSTFFLNGNVIHPGQGSGMSWIPECLLSEEVTNPLEVREIMNHYQLDPEKAWAFHRWSCPWAAKKKPEIRKLSLKLERHPEAISGLHFTDPKAGDVVEFSHPITGMIHKLTVLEYEQQELDTAAFGQEEYEYPIYHTAMTYQLEPDLSDGKFRVRDVLENESPRRKPKSVYEPDGAYSVAIIGGADGPTAVFVCAGTRTKPHAALSALHFEPTEHVTWKIVFYEKRMEDVEVELI